MVKENKLELVIELPEKVEARIDGSFLVVRGVKGEVKRDIFNPMIKLQVKDGKIMIMSDKLTKREKKIGNSYQAHIRNMIKGASEGHTYVLKICSSHFPMNVVVNNRQLVIKNFLGEKFPRTLDLKDGADVKVEGDKIIVESASKEIAGMISSDIEKITRRPNFDMRIFQDGIYITRKDGKEIK